MIILRTLEIYLSYKAKYPCAQTYGLRVGVFVIFLLISMADFYYPYNKKVHGRSIISQAKISNAMKEGVGCVSQLFVINLNKGLENFLRNSQPF